MTVFALHSRVCSQQGKPVLVILNLLHGNIPSLDRVAICAIRAHLSLVHVGVAILAILSNVGENRFYVALRALHFFVHATQRILGLVMIKLRNSTDRPPSRSGVAILTRNRKSSVRTTAVLPLRRRRRRVGVSWLPG